MKVSLYDVLYDGITDIKMAGVNNDKVYEIAKRLQDVLSEYKVMRYLDKLNMEKPVMLDTKTEYGYINIEKNGKKGGIIL